MTQHAFVVEDIKQLAKRNQCKNVKKENIPIRLTDRNQMMLASVFEYMIGNTDWSVVNNHNIRIIKAKDDTLAMPYMVPYDFDFSGLVNCAYSTPDQRLGIDNVRDRLYRGLPITGDELTATLDYFNQKRIAIFVLINNFNLLTASSKKDMIAYLEGFYATINNPKDARRVFASE